MNILQKIANWFQPTADAIEKFDFSPEVKEKLREIWDNLPATLQATIWKAIKRISDEYGDDLAQIIFEKVINALGIVKR